MIILNKYVFCHATVSALIQLEVWTQGWMYNQSENKMDQLTKKVKFLDIYGSLEKKKYDDKHQHEWHEARQSIYLFF